MNIEEQQAFMYFLLRERTYLLNLISLHYPFTKTELREFWPWLVHGDAHYSAQADDTEFIFRPTLGLCFNENIEWDDEIRGIWETGYEGYGTGGDIVGDGEIPFSISGELTTLRFLLCDLCYNIYPDAECVFTERPALNQAFRLCTSDDNGVWQRSGDVVSDIDMVVQKTYSKLEFSEFETMFKEHYPVCLYGDSVWANTLAAVVDTSFLGKLRMILEREDSLAESPYESQSKCKYPELYPHQPRRDEESSDPGDIREI